ncbi:MAG: hypothetical protein A4E67_00791 [Syntrophaceae bacterium PtaB.Bin038]|nr:MAG: hypothetical protein A4E67_00791 [Syntrophaceae bacterium PtaB.Bin038]
MATLIRRKRMLLLLLLSAGGLIGFFGPKVSPEMKEVIDQFSKLTQREVVLKKYAVPGVVPKELTQCDMTKPIVTKTEEKDGITYYTLESTVEKCEHSPAATGTVRIFQMGWKNGKIVKFSWGGPKGGKVEY